MKGKEFYEDLLIKDLTPMINGSDEKREKAIDVIESVEITCKALRGQVARAIKQKANDANFLIEQFDKVGNDRIQDEDESE